jgi:hypothetical protein
MPVWGYYPFFNSVEMSGNDEFFYIFVIMFKVIGFMTLLIFLISCGGNEDNGMSKAKANNVQTEKAIKPLPKVVNNRISIKRQFVPDEDLEIFVLDLHGEDFENSKLSFVILDKNRDTLFARKNISGKILLTGADDETDTEEEQVEYIIQKMSMFFSVKNFSTPPYTINDPNSDDFNGDLKVWGEIDNDTTAVCFEFSLLANGGSEVMTYSRLLDSIVVYDRTH